MVRNECVKGANIMNDVINGPADNQIEHMSQLVHDGGHMLCQTCGLKQCKKFGGIGVMRCINVEVEVSIY